MLINLLEKHSKNKKKNNWKARRKQVEAFQNDEINKELEEIKTREENDEKHIKQTNAPLLFNNWKG